MKAEIEIKAGWWTWLMVPMASKDFAASPIYVEQVEPLKSGSGLLRLTLIHVIHPVSAQRRVVTLRVLFRGKSHLTATIKEDDGTVRTVVVAMPDYDWLATFCPLLMKRRLRRGPEFIVVGMPPPPGPTPVEYLEDVFGVTPVDILKGATKKSFGKNHPPLTSKNVQFSVDLTFDPFDSWMIARGFVPKVMEEKWFIYMDGGGCCFVAAGPVS